MSGSDSGSDDERDKLAGANEAMPPHKTPRKKASTKRSLDMQRKISLSKLREEKESKNNDNSQSPESSSSSPSINNSHTMPVKQKCHRATTARNGKVSDGYDQYLKQYLLQVPMPKDYGEPSSDDLSSEWDSDSVADNKIDDVNNKESKVRFGVGGKSFN